MFFLCERGNRTCQPAQLLAGNQINETINAATFPVGCGSVQWFD
jgi:hypothetical protein